MKRTFLLLEVLIALALVALCAIPLIVKPLRAYREELKTLETAERERLSDWTFSEIKEQLIANQISWEKLPKLHETKGPFSLEPGKIHLLDKEKQIERSFTLYGQGEKDGESGELYRMIYVHVHFNPVVSKKQKPYTYRVAVQRKEKKEQFSPNV
ncbi:MAG: hypothetical protein FJZ64_02975 [Chlamydiae bacterium]|nr:hypothetical protein [Chlamydiota bacterium]